jgi:SM-20-related protein
VSDPAAALQPIVDAIAERGWCETREFLPLDPLRALAGELRAKWKEGALRPAGVGAGAEHRLQADVRGDHVVWLEPPGATVAQRICLDRFEALRLALNRELQLGLFDFECHLALYPPGAFYRRHLDRLASDDRRTLSCVLYLNEGWGADDGGALRLQLPGGSRDVLPCAPTLVAFLSERFEHEVLPARRERLSLTGWFRRRV